MEEHSFDSLSKEMADNTISRGKALKLVGAALLGGAFAGLVPGTAEAQPFFGRRRRGRRRGQTTVFCGVGSFNNLNNCTDSAGRPFFCSSNFGGFGNSVQCSSGPNRYVCSFRNNNGFGGVTLSCRLR